MPPKWIACKGCGAQPMEQENRDVDDIARTEAKTAIRRSRRDPCGVALRLSRVDAASALVSPGPLPSWRRCDAERLRRVRQKSTRFGLAWPRRLLSPYAMTARHERKPEAIAAWSSRPCRLGKVDILVN